MCIKMKVVSRSIQKDGHILEYKIANVTDVKQKATELFLK